MSTVRKEIDFERPPIVEVAVGVGFTPITAFTAPYFGRFWDVLGPDFPNCEQKNPILRNPPLSVVDLGDAPIRCWLLSKSGDRLVQLQNDALIFNWRRQEASAAYPEYTSIKPEFLKQLDHFSDFVKDQFGIALAFNRYELTYVNLIPVTDGVTVLGLGGELVVDHMRSRHERLLPQPAGFDWSTTYPLPEHQGQLSIRATSAIENSDARRHLVRLELSAVCGRTRSGVSPSDWLDMAHNWITQGFVDVTNPDIQREVWQRK